MRRHERRSPHLRQLDRLLMPSIPRIQERKDVDGIDERAAVPETSGSLHVLDLLAELLELALRGKDEVGDREVARLGARRVELAVDLLHEEVDPLADGPLLAWCAVQRGEVALEPAELLGDVAAFGEHRDLVRDPVRVELLAADEPHEPLLDLTTEGGERLRQAAADASRQRAHLGGAPAHVALEVGALAAALAVEGTERRAERPLQRRPLPSEVGGFLGYLEQTRQPQHVAERRPARQPQRLHELAHGADVRPRESGLHRHAIPALRRDRRAQHRHLDPSALRRLPHAIADLRLPCHVLARHRHLDVEEALVEAAYLDRHARAACLGRAGAVARHAPHAHRRTSRASSSALTVAVPIFPTTTPAAWLASTVASSSVPPAPSASAQAASTVSPAPVTSNTSRAAVRNSSTTTPCGPRLKSAIPSSPRAMSTAPASHLSRSRARASRKVAAAWQSMPEAAAASSRLGFTSDARR